MPVVITGITLMLRFFATLETAKSSVTELSKVGGLGETRAKNIKKILKAQSKHLKKINQKTLHDT